MLITSVALLLACAAFGAYEVLKLSQNNAPQPHDAGGDRRGTTPPSRWILMIPKAAQETLASLAGRAELSRAHAFMTRPAACLPSLDRAETDRP